MRKSIFITGAASGIGRATARWFVERGWFAGIFDVDTAALTLLAEELGVDRCCAHPLNVACAEEWQAALAEFGHRTGGRMDVLFNCAGILTMGAFSEIPLEVHVRTLQVNALGPLLGIATALPLPRATAGSKIINMSSASAFYGTPEMASYSASKFAVRGLTEALHLELERFGIFVCDLMPLYVNTPMIARQSHPVGSLRFFGAQLSSETAAGMVWRAAHSRKVHWVFPLSLRIATAAGRCFPALERLAVRWLSRRR